MEKGIKLKYKLEELPSNMELIMLGLQWFVVAVPIIIMVGKLAAAANYPSLEEQVIYIQKVLFISGLAFAGQALWGHGLPIITGPASILLITILASGRGPEVIYTAEILAGLALFLASAGGFFSKMKGIFTPRVVSLILLLIALTLIPTIINLIFAGVGHRGFANFLFALILIAVLFIANRYFQGIWKANLIFLAMLVGTLLYNLIFGVENSVINSHPLLTAEFLTNYNLHWSLDFGTILAFFLSFLALAVNDLGSTQSTGFLIDADQLPKRTNRGLVGTGLANMLSGFMGVIGVVSYSFGPGIIASTGSASRYAVIPAALGILMLSFSPVVVGYISAIPSVVLGVILVYIMAAQVASGLVVVLGDTKHFGFEDGLVIGLPLMLALIVTFLPSAIIYEFPYVLRPLLGNGFVMGVVAVLLLEHILYKR